MTIEGIRLRIKKKYIAHTAGFRSKVLKNKDFTIISNNCWAGFVYQSYALEYNTPTIGLFMMADEYIRFLSNLRYYIEECEIQFIKPEDSRYVDFLSKDNRFGTYPIGLLGDVEIAFLHYHSEGEASEKWNRRKKRINWDKLLVKFNDQNLCSKDCVEKFQQLSFKNKLFFTVNSEFKSEDAVYIRKSNESIFASQEPIGASLHCNINNVINSL